ncbi:hypothetical protein DXU03_06155 [Rhizobium johnstonii]
MFGISPPFSAMSPKEPNAGRRKQFNIWLERSHEERFRAVEPPQYKWGVYPREEDVLRKPLTLFGIML